MLVIGILMVLFSGIMLMIGIHNIDMSYNLINLGNCFNFRTDNIADTSMGGVTLTIDKWYPIGIRFVYGSFFVFVLGVLYILMARL